MIDAIFIAQDPKEFHCENFDKNYSHYSFLSKRLPLAVTHSVVQRKGSQLYFNPLIPLKTFSEEGATGEFEEGLRQDQRKFKYGVIAKEDALRDLKEWNTFALAGRTQKPVLDFICDPEITEAIL